MDSSKASNVAKDTRDLENGGEETVTNIIGFEVDRCVDHMLVTLDEQNNPCCSRTLADAPVTSDSHPPCTSNSPPPPPPPTTTSPIPPPTPTPTLTSSPTTPLTTMNTANAPTLPPLSLPPTPPPHSTTATTIPVHPSLSSPPAMQPTTARTSGPHIISMSDFAVYPPHGPPPSYSKSLLDRRIHPCASIQFVAPIPPPSYDGFDNELRYSGAAANGFTLGMGNTWQRQPQPAYCPACDSVVITRLSIKTSRIAHIFALVMFLLLCWPFCLLPYFISACNSTIHHCSMCNTPLGTRGPFERS